MEHWDIVVNLICSDATRDYRSSIFQEFFLIFVIYRVFQNLLNTFLGKRAIKELM
jgi:hypothetical protein